MAKIKTVKEVEKITKASKVKEKIKDIVSANKGGNDPLLVESNGSTDPSLERAIKSHAPLKEVKDIIKKKPELVNQFGSDVMKTIPLLLSIKYPDPKVFELLLKSGANPNLLHESVCAMPLLHYLCIRDDIPEETKKIIKTIKKHSKIPLDIEKRDQHGQTPLMVASNGMNFDIMKELLTMGANPTSTDKLGITPLAHLKKNNQYYRQSGLCKSCEKMLVKAMDNFTEQDLDNSMQEI